MSYPLPPLRLTGATILRDGVLQQRSVAIARGTITKGPLPAVDLSGYYILPGIIDLHGDAFERHIAPRPTAPFPMATGLRATDMDAASNGVTTAYLAQGWSWEGGSRAPDGAESFLQALAAYRAQMQVDLRTQLRCETHTVDSKDRLLEVVARYGVDFVVFNNHLDEYLDLADNRPDELAHWARKFGRTADEQLALVRRVQAVSREVPRFLCNLAERFDDMGVIYGSHDDPDGDTRETYSLIGAKICEFPTARAPAALAKAVGDPVLMGAPNVVRGGSQSGGISAMSLIKSGLCDALVSDYYYPSLAQAAFRLVSEDVLPLPEAWAMISTRPAQIMRLHDRGVIDYGKRADLAIVNADTKAIEATISAGRIVHLTGEAANRFLSKETDMPLAAE
ncbi:alpha-D-ribose 1-methylphosphonate 5-triphosphate diphosphatase [Cognatishimia sp. SS12]|uniref:alpha-D-ribose 1-methylphosphonate 5-triphosphate diphosphatase n=1 Tax=Cognatishimia sp. SS12 TaxID=2979465 RepID=UPI002330C7F7|nr:alpha-D-ribose 1-methylphosphonate 5-triphosphate diphosphatase [Cognatishimia sp. SS12]MDC0738448.1 alpha-D-ribose 1-methylphosphonate 5-triphosphate diphosphatase [Cognatishimia sp. SS12]